MNHYLKWCKSGCGKRVVYNAAPRSAPKPYECQICHEKYTKEELEE